MLGATLTPHGRGQRIIETKRHFESAAAVEGEEEKMCESMRQKCALGADGPVGGGVGGKLAGLRSGAKRVAQPTDAFPLGFT